MPDQRTRSDGEHEETRSPCEESMLNATQNGNLVTVVDNATPEDNESEIDRLRRENRALEEAMMSIQEETIVKLRRENRASAKAMMAVQEEKTALLVTNMGLITQVMAHMKTSREQAAKLLEMEEINKRLRAELEENKKRHGEEQKRKETILRSTKAENNSLRREVDGYVRDIGRRTSNNKGDVSKKRSFEQMSTPNRIHHKKNLVVCLRCYQYNLPCDTGVPCRHCEENKSECIRAKCTEFDAGTCNRQHCTRAHSNSGFPPEHLCEPRHISRDITLPRKRKKQAQETRSE